MKLKFRLKGGAGSGNYGHAGRPGLIGGSSNYAPKIFAVVSNSRRKANIYTVNGGGDLPISSMHDITPDGAGDIAYSYDPKDKLFYISGHTDFRHESYERQLPNWSAKRDPIDYPRGLINVENNTITIYDAIYDLDYIASVVGLPNKQVERQINASQRSLLDNIITLDGHKMVVKYKNVSN